MDQVVKGLWTTALRSGEYQQGVGFLKVKDGSGTFKHCCLGVLCDLAVAEGIVTAREVEDELNGQVTIYGSGHDCFPPRDVWVWAGLGDDNPQVNDPHSNHLRSLVDLNDSGKTFAEIADLIDEGL